tara:strand:- start:629 stop:1126 length:498 start_codon:yes stop_codon:yes gene_type:complete
MLKQEILKKLNVQINLEHFSSNLYLSMSSWCKAKGLDGAAGFLIDHSNEELGHMHKLFNYINETGGQAIVSGIGSPENKFKDLKDVFEQTYKHEKYITAKINELVEFTLNQKDYATFNFLQWYVREQHEEEALFNGILDKIDIIGLEGRGLYIVDKEIGLLRVKN